MATQASAERRAATSRYDVRAVEAKWKERWEKAGIHRTDTFSDKPTYYCLVMFPYPSGSGLSVGHLRNYIPVDVMARFKRMQGHEVLHPMGWDAFGLPAEQDAIDKGRHPAETTREYAANYRRQLTLVGCGYDWEREIDSSMPEYYRWTQWFFLLLHRRGLAYRAEKRQWWCDVCGALADEEVLADGTDWRGHSGIYKKPLKQWFFKITDYADRLSEDLELVDYPEQTRRAQINWVGRSEGADVVFKTERGDELSVFTTRPDTLFGATFMVLAPEHPLVERLMTAERKEAVEEYVRAAALVSEIDRTSTEREKTGVFTGTYAVNPVNEERIPIWIADYVLLSYGSGAIMAVPGHDDRDFEFAGKYGLPIPVVVAPPDWDGEDLEEAYLGSGKLVNSGEYGGLEWEEGFKRIVADLEKRGLGKLAVNYRLRDWLISRQRYWGCPIPIVHCEDCGEVAVPEEELPVLLPEVTDFRPSPERGSPLEAATEWVNTTCPDCGKPAKRETDTLGGFACSSWYFLRFITPNFDEGPFEREAAESWMPVDLYVGGAEHTVMHLLYSRFWYKVMYDEGMVSAKEPYAKLRHQGMLLAQDGWVEASTVRVTQERASSIEAEGMDVYAEPTADARLLFHAPSKAEFETRPERMQGDGKEWVGVRSGKMSKSLGNVVTPDEIVDRYGADCLRGYELFMAPMDGTLPWNENGLNGISRFYNRIWDLVVGRRVVEEGRQRPPLEEARALVRKIIHKAVKKCTGDLEELRFNTMIANGLMEPVNALLDIWSPELAETEEGREVLEKLIRLLAPTAPHLAEELWERTGHEGPVVTAPWPGYDEALTVDETVTLVVQVNGKVRDRLVVDAGIEEEEAKALALASPNVQTHVGGKTIQRVIFVPGRLLNLVVG